MGTPVVAADRPYAHDVCGDAAVYFDPLDPASLASAVARLAEEAGLAERLSRLGRASVAARAAARPYDRMIDVTLDVAEGGAP